MGKPPVRGLIIGFVRSLVTGREAGVAVRHAPSLIPHFTDAGLGMTHSELIENLGTIAHSGSKAFLEQLKAKQADASLIGQFGVGFYAAFMVADEVVVTTLSGRPGSEAAVWRSTGDGRFTIEPGQREQRGTTIVLHLKSDAQEFLDRWRLEGLIKRARLKGRK